MAKIEIKTIVTGGDQAAQDLNKTSQALSQTIQVTKQTGEATEQLTVKKSKLADALKKVSHEIPGLSYGLALLKNPFVALSAVIAISINWFQKLTEEIEDMRRAVGSGQIGDQFKNLPKVLGEANTKAKELAENVERIRGKPATVQEQGVKAQADLDRSLQVEAAADEQAKAQALAGVRDPEARAAIEARFEQRAKLRAQRKLGGVAAIAAEKEFRGRQEFAALQEQLPGEREALAKATARRDELLGLAQANTTPEGEIVKLQETLQGLDEFIKSPETSVHPRALALGLGFITMDQIKAHREVVANTLENAQRGNQQADVLRQQAQAGFDAAQGRFNRFGGALTGAAENARQFAVDRDTAMADANAMRPFNDPGAAGRIQALNRTQAAFDRLLHSLELMFNDGQRRVDALSRQGKATQQDIR